MSKKNLGVHVYVRRVVDGEVFPVNYWEWENMQSDSTRRHKFEFVRQIDLRNLEDEDASSSGDITPVIEDELECILCGFVAPDDTILQKHKKSTHD